jgi:hypothetical protein
LPPPHLLEVCFFGRGRFVFQQVEALVFHGLEVQAVDVASLGIALAVAFPVTRNACQRA